MAPPTSKARRKGDKIGSNGSLGSVSQWEILPLVLMSVGLFRWAAGLWGYSGYQNPPMYGDYEAQRHWMELTTNLPISQWYFHDLAWWGLDYPPLTAYHSWFLGKIGSVIEPQWFALYSSRGMDDAGLKVFMRATVIVSEYLIYIPAAAVFVRRFSRLGAGGSWGANAALVAILMQPATILIDHVHFQYNTVMLGFVIASMSSMLAGRLLWACVFFVMALGFKQMALYYAPAIFAYLLGICVFPSVNIGRLFSIAIVTAISFAVLLLPIYLGALYDSYKDVDVYPDIIGKSADLPLFTAFSSYINVNAWYYPLIQQTAQLLHRIFPFARGLFEDKVANFWCALNVAIKLKSYDAALLQKASLLLTLAGISIPCLIIFIRPRKELLPLALAATSWSFFLFSFQVHEKSVLLPLMPMTLLLAGEDGLSPMNRSWIALANTLGTWTLFPLLKRVDLQIPYVVFQALWSYGMYKIPSPQTRPVPVATTSTATTTAVAPSVNLTFAPGTSQDEKNRQLAMLLESRNDPMDLGNYSWYQLGSIVVQAFFYQVMVAWHILEAFLKPGADLPDLWVVANVGIGCAGFGVCFLWCLGRLVVESGLLGGRATTTDTSELEDKKRR